MDTEQKKQIGERLALVRAAKRMSQKAMGEHLSVPWRTYQNYETGSREMPVDFAVAYCEKLDVRIEWLVNGTGGQRRQSGLDSLVGVLVRIDDQARATGSPLPQKSIADIAVRLLRKEYDGHAITDQDFEDYIDLKRES
ncbi:MAG: helix-turn-helix transcriptional regulator [Pseudomonadota bacterium]